MELRVDITVDQNSVNSKIDTWAQSADAKRKMADKIDEYIDKDKRVTDAGSRVITKAWASELANELCQMITRNASTLPASIVAHVNSLQPMKPMRTSNGGIKVFINFTDTNMERISLAPDIYGFTDNIVVMFEKGWNAQDYTYGMYNGRRIRSRKTYPGAYFIHNAVDEFNSRYASLEIVASIPSIYG